MSSSRRNILVAVTVLGALAALGWMIIQFGGTLGGLAGGGGYPVTMTTPRVDGLAEGNRVRYRGFTVGRVESIDFSDEGGGFDVVLVMRYDTPVPANVRGVVTTSNLISGGADIALELEGETPDGRLEDGDGSIPGEYGSAALIPPEFALLANQFEQFIAELRASNLVDTVNEQAVRIGELAQSMDELVGDPELQSNLNASLANIRTLTETANETAIEYRRLGERMNGLATQVEGVLNDAGEIAGEFKTTSGELRETVASARTVVDDTGASVARLTTEFEERVVELETTLKRVDNIMAKVDEGEGTLGLLLNDPRAYESLAADLALMNEILADVERLVEQIEAEGFKFSVF